MKRPKNKAGKKSHPFALVIHGGAGDIKKDLHAPGMEEKYRDALSLSLDTGYTILAGGGSSVDAVEASVKVMEDSPLFNAGRGSVFTNEGKIEMDAAVMDGKTLNAGAVAFIRIVKNPVSLARKVMENSHHVMLVGSGAEQFAKLNGLDIVPESYFFTQERWDQLQAVLARGAKFPDHDAPANKRFNEAGIIKFGTVGAVALDTKGNLAAATSTGGITNKSFGRVGDSPLIGAGTYANNISCAVSATGYGEYFIRAVAAHDVSSLMNYRGYSIQDAANQLVNNKLKKIGGHGGLIAVDNKGNVAMPFNTKGMYRGYKKSDGKKEVLIYRK